MTTRQGLAYALLLAVASASVLVSSADAGWPWPRARCWDRPSAYTPETRHYVVVSPTTAPVVPSAATCDAGKTPVTWDMRHASPQAYPWGWFGTGSPQQPMVHTSYYGTYRDHKLMRSW